MKTCPHCQKRFIPKTTKAIYCSKNCCGAAYMRRLRADPIRGAETKRKDAIRLAKWIVDNPEKALESNRKIRRFQSKARKRRNRSTIDKLTPKQWKSTVSVFRGRCAYCGTDGYLEQEHFIPVVKGGEYSRKNIVPACSKCNSKKRAKWAIDWMVDKPNGLARYAEIKSYLDNND